MSNQKHPAKKQDPPINEEWLAIREMIQKHTGTALTVVLIAVVAGVAVWSIAQRQDQRKQEAQHLLATAQSTAQFEEIITRFPSSDAAPLASLSLAKLHFDLGRYEDAMTSYDAFLVEWQDHPLASTAILGRLFSLEALASPEQIQEAEAGFRAFAESHPAHYLYPQARLGEARCKQHLGMLDEARSIYQNFLATHPGNPWAIQIEERLIDLERKISRQQSS